MHIESVTLVNFRCFGPEPTVVTFRSGVTVLVGPNGAGKSALIEALRRVFGPTRDERTLTRADVHFAADENPDDVEERQVSIDVVFAFPELDAEAEGAEQTVPSVFQVMAADKPGEPLKARVRLEALWRQGESYLDEVESALYWVTHLGEVQFGEEGSASLDKRRVMATDRSKIQLAHIPATRDGAAVVRQVRTLLRRLERTGNFGEEAKAKVQDLGDDLQTTIEDLPSIKWIVGELKQVWGALHTMTHLSEPRLVVVQREFTHLLRALNVRLSPHPDGREREVEELSEGQASLFFLALAATLSKLELALSDETPPEGFNESDVSAPALRIYTVEEPENHLSPFYLSRLMDLLEGLCEGAQAMGVVTSHAPGVVRRVPPEAIRHLNLDRKTLVSKVSRVRLPKKTDEAAKFVRQAVWAQPEIYFAQIVILGEGDSESIVLPRVARALGIDLDPAFVAFAPLGGRHVNHFWRLLAGLSIPTLTLLDLDIGRQGAGPLRLKYAFDQLKRHSAVEAPDWVKGDPSTASYWKTRKSGGVDLWRKWCASNDVFFSYPLDLDMMMLRAFPKAYGVDVEDTARMASIKASVFGKGDGLEAYKDLAPDDAPSLAELTAYEELFKKRSKPASHLEALSGLDDKAIRASCPKPLRALIERAQKILASSSETEGEAA